MKRSSKGIIMYHKGILLLFMAIMIIPIGFSQRSEERRQLEDQQKRLRQQIEYNRKLLNEARKSREASLLEMNLLNNQIGRRRELILTIDSEISYLTNQLKNYERTIAQLEIELNRLRSSYAKLIYLSYKIREADHRLLYLLASENLNQAWNRMRFFRQLVTNRKSVFIQLASTIEDARETRQIISDQLKEQQKLKTDQRRESLNLTKEQQKKGEVLNKIKQQEDRIRAEINRQQREADALDVKIKRIIEEEIRRAAERKRDESERAAQISEAEIKLSNNFSANKGKLPLPVDQGTISSTFGRHRHPDFDIYTENNGIDILTTSGSNAKVVFDGVVSEIIRLPSYYAVLVKHGEYFTLYSKLESVFVRKGETIKTGHLIGLIRTYEQGTELHFELWKGKTKQNPQEWLRRF